MTVNEWMGINLDLMRGKPVIKGNRIQDPSGKRTSLPTAMSFRQPAPKGG